MQRWLSSTKPARGDDLPPLLRRTEKAGKLAGKAGPKTVWQIFGNGTVGSQAILGIPAAKRLVDDLGDKAAVWPFTTGWSALTAEDVKPREAVIAEIYPSLFAAKADAGEVIDQAQVRAAAEHFARLDEAGKLGAAFTPPKTSDDETRTAVEREEGWILGV